MRYRTNQMERLKALCNACVIEFIVGMLIMGFIHSNAARITGFILMMAGVGLGYICGAILNQLEWNADEEKRKRMALELEDKKAIKSGKFLYVLELGKGETKCGK